MFKHCVRIGRHNAHERWTVPCAAAYAALCRSNVQDLRVVTRSYSLSQLFAVAAIAAQNTRDISPIRR